MRITYVSWQATAAVLPCGVLLLLLRWFVVQVLTLELGLVDDLQVRPRGPEGLGAWDGGRHVPC